MADVKDRQGNTLAVGDSVLLLQIPVIGDHEFILGKVLQFTKKKVKIEVTKRDRWGSTGNVEVLRYPDQIFKTQMEYQS